MRKIFNLFLLLMLSISSYTQVNLDSLWNIWNDKTKADTTRLEAVHYFIQGGLNKEFSTNPFFVQNTDSLLVLIESVNALTKASGSKRYALMAVRQRGIYLQNIQNLQEAVKLYEQALEMANAMKDKRLILMSTVTLANGEKAWGLANGLPDTIILAQAEKRYLEALNLFELESFSSGEVAVNPDPQLSNYAWVAQYHLGHLNLVLNNFPNGIQYIEKALVVAERSGNNFNAGSAMSLLGMVQFMQRDYPKARQYFEQAIVLAGKAGDEHLLEELMGRLGGVLQAERNYPAAIRYFTKSLKIAEEKGDNHWIAHNLQSLGDLYTQVGEFAKAEDYLTRSVASMKAAGPTHRIEQTTAYIGLHNVYIKQESYSKAILNDSIFLKLAGEVNLSAVPIGMVMLTEDYQKFGDYAKALQYGFKALKAIDEMPPNHETAYMRNHVSVNIGNAYRKQNLFAKAIIWCEKASTDPDVELQKDACECLYESHKALKHGNEALAYHERFLFLSDSLNTQELSKNLQQMEFAKQVLTDSIAQVEKDRLVEEARQEEIRQTTQTRNILIGFGFAVLLFSGGLWSRLRYIRKSKAALQLEKDRSENLLLNILPAEIAEELKANGRAEARDFENVSILFTDFKEFTKTSEKLTAQELVGEINYCFEAFDGICGKYKVEKIKTIGDAYMAAGGLPVPTADADKNTVLAALEMQQFIVNRKAKQEALGKPAFEMRVGIHTGPIVAGIVGVKKFQYDIWGDTVNTASRVESNGEVGRVNISQSTYEAIKEEATFTFEKREKIQVKGKGEMEMYFVSNEKIS